MLCIRLKGFDRTCQKTSGGVSKIWIFDRDDFNFTQAADEADGSKAKYTAIARRSGATVDGGAFLFPVVFQYKEAEYKYTQSLNGSSVKYEHSLEFLLANLDHFISQWNDKVDAAAACCGIGVIVQLNSGIIFVLGEKYVNAEAIPEWRMAQSGSTGTSGKLFEDANGQTTILTGDYSRSAYEYSGALSTLTALEEEEVTKAKPQISIKKEFGQTVIAFGNSGLPLNKRSDSDIIDLGIIARDSGDITIIKLFDKLPTLAELRNMKMQEVEKTIIKSGIEKSINK